MSSRRPRIKAVANIGVKRKIKGEVFEKPIKEFKSQIEEPVSNDDNTNSTIEEKNSTELHEDVKTSNLLISDTHTQMIRPRQRIKATPCFDVRRNSLHGQNPLDNEMTDNNLDQMKEPKPPSAILQSPNRPQNLNRTRTESFTLPNQQTLQIATSSINSDYNHHYPPSREHIPQRHRKISTMEDTHRLSTARKDFNSKCNRKTPEKSVLKMYEFIYYNPSSNPMKFDEKCSASTKELHDAAKFEKEIEPIKVPDDPVINLNNEKETKPENEIANSIPVPQVKLGPNGEIIIDEKSLVIETTAEKQVRSNLAASKNFIYLDEYSGNNGFYSRQKRTKDWSAEETIKFYRCLHTVGTDFSLMLTLFPDRSRRDLKLKFKKEEKFNGSLINKAILYPKEFDIEELKKEFEREKEIIKEKHKAWSEAEKIPKIDPNDDIKLINKSKGSRVLSKGTLAYKNENITRLTQSKSRKKRETIKKIKKELMINNKELTKIEKDDEDLNISENLSSFDSDEVVAAPGGSVEITDIGEIFSFGDIIPELKGSSLALVSSVDDNCQDSGKVTHEIFIVCKETKVLSKKPLDLPKDTIDRILLVMGKYDDVQEEQMEF